ncbi:MAG: glycine cleavage system protein GcvH [Pseudonocardiales bacterium]|nr:glycine cleavage system protein GcvH [Pseudonocardiales bacterium]
MTPSDLATLGVVSPEDLRYTDAHEWVKALDRGLVRVGITDYAQRQLGDIVFVQLPAVGDSARAGEPLGEIESTKSVSDLYAPLAGEVVAANEALADTPELVNSDPYGAGWIVELRLSDSSAEQLDGLLDATAYRALTDES